MEKNTNVGNNLKDDLYSCQNKEFQHFLKLKTRLIPLNAAKNDVSYQIRYRNNNINSKY